MVGIVSALSTANEAVSAIQSLAFGATGGVVLGDFVFDGFEVPESIPFGGGMAMTVHKLPGGERVIDLLGDDPADISWSGTMIDNFPITRAQQLDQMRIDGNPLPLHWGNFLYTVIISRFEARVMYSRVGYNITCCILRNEASAQLPSDPSLTDGVVGDIASALASVPATIGPALAQTQSYVAALGKLVPGSPLLAQASATIGAVNGQLTTLSLNSGAALSVIASGAPSGSLISSVSDMSSAVTNGGILAQAQQGAAFLGRAVRNLT